MEKTGVPLYIFVPVSNMADTYSVHSIWHHTHVSKASKIVSGVYKSELVWYICICILVVCSVSTVMVSDLVKHNYKLQDLADRLSLLIGCHLS